MDYFRQFLEDRFGIDIDQLTFPDVRKIVELSVNNKLLFEDESFHGIYHVYEIKNFTCLEIDVKSMGVYSPVLGAASSVDELLKTNKSEEDAVYL